MGKWLLLVAVVAGFFWWLRQRALRSGRRAPSASAPTASNRSAAPSAPTQQAMVACAHCGVHLPRGEALPEDLPTLNDGQGVRWYCTVDHRAASRAGGR